MLTNSQPQANTMSIICFFWMIKCVEKLKQFFLYLLRNACAIIFNCNLNAIRKLLLDNNINFPFLLSKFKSISNEIHKNLFNSPFILHHKFLLNVTKFGTNSNSLLFSLHFKEVNNIQDYLSDFNFLNYQSKFISPYLRVI